MASCFHLASCLQGLPMSEHGSVLRFGLTLSNIPLYAQTTSCLRIHPLMDVRVISTFWLLYIYALMCKFLCGHVLPFLLGIYLGVQSTGSYCTCTLKRLRNCQHLFPKWLHPLTLPPAVCEGSHVSIPPTTQGGFSLVDSSHPSEYELVPHCGSKSSIFKARTGM